MQTRKCGLSTVLTLSQVVGDSLSVGEDLELVVLAVAEHEVQLEILERLCDQEPTSAIVRLARFQPQYVGRGTTVTVTATGHNGCILQVRGPSHLFPEQSPEQSPEQKYGLGYPESEKVFELRPKYQVIEEFIGWLQQNEGLVFCRRMDGTTNMVYANGQASTMQAAYLPQIIQTENWLHEFFGINRHELRREQNQMVDELRNPVKPA